MAVPAGTFSVGRAVGNREDLQDKIYMISPSDTPFISMAGQGSAEAVLHEWQTDTLAAVDANNAGLEGDDPSIALAAPTARLGNNVQIFRKTVGVSGTQEAVKKAGRTSEMDYQTAKRGKELKRDMERILSGEQARSAGTVDGSGYQTAARKSRGMEHFITTNVSYGASGANGANDTTALTDGTQRDLTEALFKGVVKAAWEQGGEPDVAIMGPTAKTVASGFTGRSSAREIVAANKVQASASVYASDFGDIKFLPSRFTRARTTLILDKNFYKVAYLRRMKRIPLAKSGDNEKLLLLCEACLQVGNEAAHGKVADLNT